MADRTTFLVIEYLISLPHACAMMKKFKVKKHASAGYFFELNDLGISFFNVASDKRVAHLCEDTLGRKKWYTHYSLDSQACHLKVYRTLPT